MVNILPSSTNRNARLPAIVREESLIRIRQCERRLLRAKKRYWMATMAVRRCAAFNKLKLFVVINRSDSMSRKAIQFRRVTSTQVYLPKRHWNSFLTKRWGRARSWQWLLRSSARVWWRERVLSWAISQLVRFAMCLKYVRLTMKILPTMIKLVKKRQNKLPRKECLKNAVVLTKITVRTYRKSITRYRVWM